MDILTHEYLGNTVEQWLEAAGLTVVAYIIILFALRLIIRRVAKLAALTETSLDDVIVELLKRIRWFVLLSWSAYFGVQNLNFDPRVMAVFQPAVVLISLLQIGIWGNFLISFWVGRSMKERLEEDAASATTLAGMRFVGKLVLGSVLLLVALDNLGVDITALVAGLGVGGIAVALALQSILGDLFASLSIVLDKPFAIGDFVVIGDFAGSVEYIGLKTTRLRSLSGEQIVFSNSDLLGSRIRNFKRMAERRILFTIGVTYQTTKEQLRAIPGTLRAIVERQKLTRFDRAHFKEYGDSALVFEVVYFVQTGEYGVYMDIQQAINMEIFETFEKEGIAFAYPTRTLFIEKGSS